MNQSKLCLIALGVLLFAVLVTAVNDTNLMTSNESLTVANASQQNISSTSNEPLDNTENSTTNQPNVVIINATTTQPDVIVEDADLNDYKEKLNDDTYEELGVGDDLDEKDIIIKFKNTIQEEKLNEFYYKKNIDRFGITKAKGRIKDIKKLLEDSEVEFLEIDQDITLFADQYIPWNINKTKAPDVWHVAKGNGVDVAILDSGIDTQHEDLDHTGGASMVSNSYHDEVGHGTQVAGVIAAVDNDVGVIGIASDIDLYAVKITDSTTGELSKAIEGVEWAIDNNMDIVVMSFGMESYSQIFKEVLEEAYNDDILLVAAAGNDGDNQIMYPAAYSTVIAVGGIDHNNEKAGFSNTGPELELVAPATGIYTTTLLDNYESVQGTSFAVPHVAGVAALIKSFNSNLTNEEIRGKLQNDALDLGDTGRDDIYGYGLVRANVETTNFTFEPLSYYYEVFNITTINDVDYYNFWVSGTGTLDDLNFGEGYYLANVTTGYNATYTYKFMVGENGTLVFLAGESLDVDDDYTSDGSTSSDGIAFKDGVLRFKVTPDPLETNDMECIDWNYDGDWGFPSDIDECWAPNQAQMDQCVENDQDASDLCGIGGSATCYTTGHGGWHSLSGGTGTRKKVSVRAMYFDDCNDVPVHEAFIDHVNATIISPKFYLCDSDNSSQYQVMGNYSQTGNITWATFACAAGGTCNTALDEQEVSTAAGTISNPCGNATDLAIVDVIPVQVVPNVDMVKDKSGYVRVVVTNNGPSNATGNVSVIFNGGYLTPVDSTSAFIQVNETVNIDFNFKPTITGTNLSIQANVSVME